MSLAELINFEFDLQRSIAIHGRAEEFEIILVLFPFHYVLKMDELSEQELVNHLHHDSIGRTALPPLWYSEFCTFCKNHSEEKCVLLVYGVTRCEWDKQVIMNPVALDHSAHDGPMLKPLPTNSSVIFFVETKDMTQSGYYNLTGQLAGRLTHIYMRDWKTLDNAPILDAYAMYKV